MNIFDRIVAAFNPIAGERRARARFALRHYEAATAGRRLSGRNKAGGDANAAIAGSAAPSRNAARDLVRNNAWAARGLSAVVSNTVGAGILASPVTPNKARAKRVRDAFGAWADGTVDALNRLDFYGSQALVMRTVCESGEALVVKLPAKGAGVGLSLRIMEPDWLDSTRVDANTVDGIRYSDTGEAIGYWIYDQIQQVNSLQSVRAFTSSYWEAKDVIHVYRQDRPGQRRGITWLAPVVIDLHDLDGYEDAVLLRAKMAACKVDYIVQPDSYSRGPAAATITDKQEPGATEILPPGYDVRSTAAPDSGDYVPFTKQRLRRLAAGFGVSYEALTGDLSETNFASGRMGWLEMQRSIDHSRWHMLIPQFCAGVAQWWSELAPLAGIDVTGVTWQWTPPRREVVDPSREYPAMRDAMRSGIASLPEIHRSLGYDSQSVLEEIAASNAELDRLKITLDSDARKPATAAQAPMA